MIVPCPACGKRISNKSKFCTHCHFNLSDGGSGAGPDFAEAVRRRKWRLGYRLEMHLYGSILLTMIGVTWVYYDSAGLEHAPGYWSSAALAGGGLWYIGSRLYLIYCKVRSKS